MMVTAALLICGIGLFAREQFASPQQAEIRAPLVFWTLLLAVWGALNAVFIGGDLFNLYVALELLTFSAVPLVSLDGRAETLAAALRYLLVRVVRLNSLSARRGAALWRLRHPRHCPVVRPHPRGAGSVGSDLADDGWTVGQGRALPVPLMAATCPCRRSGPGQRHIVGSGRQGALFPGRPAVVRCHAPATGACGGAVPRHSGRCGNNPRQRGSTPPGAAETADRLLDRGTDRLPVPDVPARRQSRNRPSVEHCRLDRGHSSGHLTRFRQGRHVHGGGADRRGARARPDRWAYPASAGPFR